MEVMEQVSSKSETAAARSIFDAEYLSPEALARNLGISVRTLARWHVLRFGPPRTVAGRMVLYRLESPSEWLRAREDGRCNGKKRSRRAA
jgi:hypothetical protein